MRLIAKTLFGLEEILKDEIKSLGAQNIDPLNRAVVFDGDKCLLYKANYTLRTALSVLMQIAGFRISTVKDLYGGSLKVEWGRYLNPDLTFSIVPVVHSPLFRHSGYPALVVKDAVADWFRKFAGRRPSVNSEAPDIVFNLHIRNSEVNISVDSSVVPLFKRGYRKAHGPAPISEVLAAGIINLSGWDRKTPFLDPMCGSGTIPIEAGLLASGIQPGKFRDFFGFQKWPDYDPDLYNSMKLKYDSAISAPGITIESGDISETAVQSARQNIRSAGLSDVISLKRRDFRDCKGNFAQGLIIMNPPYGERIKQNDSEEFYNMIGSVLKHNFPGYSAYIITSDKELIKRIGLRPKEKKILFNGPLECSLVRYDIYEGSLGSESLKSPVSEP